MSYVLSVVAFVATIIGVAGNTWQGGRLTVIGWLVIGLALTTLTLTIVQIREQDRNRRHIADVACEQVLRGTHGLIAPFAILLADADLAKMVPGTGPTELNSRIEKYLRLNNSELSSNEVGIYEDLPSLINHFPLIMSYSLQDSAGILNHKNNWGNVFRTTALKGIDELDKALSSYSGFMDVEIIEATQKLRNVWLIQRIENLNELESSIRLNEFLQLDKKKSEQEKLTFFEEFYHAARSTAELCSEREND